MSETLDLVPLFLRIIVKEKEVKKVGSIIIPETTRGVRATEGEVLAVGDDVEALKAGDIVFYGKYSGAEIERDGQKYILMSEEDVLCLVKNGSK